MPSASLLDAGATLAFGSDWFVAPPTPLEGIYAAVTRRTLDDRTGRLGARAEDLRSKRRCAPTRSTPPAPNSTSTTRARLTPGLLADVVVLDRDILTAPADQVKYARVDMTMVGGQVVFERAEAFR